MALHIPKPPGVHQMLKDGARFFSGLDEAVHRNIGACKAFAAKVRTSYGPNGMNKLVINYLEKHFVTSDAATIVRELEVQHPAAKILIQAGEIQGEEIGDGTNFVFVLSGALLQWAEEYIDLGMKPFELADGYELALKYMEYLLPGLVVHVLKDPSDKEAVAKILRPIFQSKVFGNEDFLCSLTAEACVTVYNADKNFQTDRVRICKIPGAGLPSSNVVRGMVLKRLVCGNVTMATDAKVAIFDCPVDVSQTETKGTVLIRTAGELACFSRDEENILETQIRQLTEAGITVVVSGAKIGDMALHYLNKYGILAVRLMSKHDVQRLSRAVGGCAMSKFCTPTTQEIGHCDDVRVCEIGDTMVVAFQYHPKNFASASGDAVDSSPLATIVLRGATGVALDDAERAVQSALCVYNAALQDGRFLAGAGAIEAELCKHLYVYADQVQGIENFAIRQYALALAELPRALAENTGARATDCINKLETAHKSGHTAAGLDLDAADSSAPVCDAVEKGVFDLYVSKLWGLRRATQAACTVLRVDHIIMARRAGMPKRKPEDDDD